LAQIEGVRGTSFQLLRLALGLLALFFAYALGRMGTRLRRERQPMRRALTWALRTTVAVVAVLWVGGLDAIGIATLALVALGLAAGILLELRPPKTEQIHLFPGD
jgi:hypothetical protein